MGERTRRFMVIKKVVKEGREVMQNLMFSRKNQISVKYGKVLNLTEAEARLFPGYFKPLDPLVDETVVTHKKEDGSEIDESIKGSFDKDDEVDPDKIDKAELKKAQDKVVATLKKKNGKSRLPDFTKMKKEDVRLHRLGYDFDTLLVWDIDDLRSELSDLGEANIEGPRRQLINRLLAKVKETYNVK